MTGSANGFHAVRWADPKSTDLESGNNSVNLMANSWGKTSTAPFKSNHLSSTDMSGGRFAADSALSAASETR